MPNKKSSSKSKTPRPSHKDTKKNNNKIPKSKKYLKKTRKFRAIYKKMKHDKIVTEFLQTLNMIKLYHWKTESYAAHKATDELHEHLSKNIDQFVEVLMGKPIHVSICYSIILNYMIYPKAKTLKIKFSNSDNF